MLKLHNQLSFSMNSFYLSAFFLSLSLPLSFSLPFLCSSFSPVSECQWVDLTSNVEQSPAGLCSNVWAIVWLEETPKKEHCPCEHQFSGGFPRDSRVKFYRGLFSFQTLAFFSAPATGTVAQLVYIYSLSFFCARWMSPSLEKKKKRKERA